MAVDRAKILALQRGLQAETSAFAKGSIGNVDGASGLGVSVTLRVYTRRPQGFRRVPIEIVSSLTASQQYRAFSNKEIVARIQSRFPAYPVDAGLMDRPIEKYHLSEISKMLSLNETPLDLKVHNTLSRIKIALRGSAIIRREQCSFTKKFTFSDDAVVVGDRPYTIFTDAKNYKRISVNGHKLRVDVLRELLERAK